MQRKREFDAAFARGGKGVSAALVVYARRNELGWNRLGLVVSRKNGNAVRRNRIRRLIREAFRLENPGLQPSFDLVCIPRPGGFPDRLASFRPLFREAVLKAIRRAEGGREGQHIPRRGGRNARKGRKP